MDGQRTATHADVVREDKLNFVLFFDDDQTTMSGRVPKDLDRAKSFKRPGERLLWFRKDGREYHRP